ncbi:MAG: hypothetical protein K0S32_2730 [Bacteroidetes bacterium]|jgi:hypothetical protein|nr:hypothetical protein [Bacteroidota bacterium]
MRTIIPHLIIALSFFILNGCTVFKKEINKPVTVSYNESDFIVNLVPGFTQPKYIYNVLPEEIVNAFLSNFKSEGAATKNIKLVSQGEEADYTLKLKTFNIRETSRNERVTNKKTNFTQNITLHSVECEAEFEICDKKNPGRILRSCFNSKLRSEKIKDNSGISSILSSGPGPKLLRDDICKDLAGDVGRRIWMPITRRIAKNMK